MTIPAVRGLLLAGLQLCCSLAFCQFANTEISRKPKPIVTRSELGADSSHYMDKTFQVRDKKTGITHSIYTEFDKYKSKSLTDSSYIMYARQNPGTKMWTKAARISRFAGDCSNSDNTVKGNTPCTGPGGEVYVCWAGPKGLAFQRSLDSGLTWLSEEKLVAPIKNGWDQWVDGLHTNGIPAMACADSGQFKGRIYITWSDEKNGEKNKDVFLVYSDDRGDNWTDPILVTYRPNHKEQFNPQIAIQPVTGDVFLTYFDRQNYYDGKLCDLFMAISSNGGLKYFMYQMNEKPILLDSNVASVRGLAFVPKSREVKVVWSQVDSDNMLGIYTAVINDSSVANYLDKYTTSQMILPKSLPFKKKIRLDFELKGSCKVTAFLTKPLEPGFSKEVIHEQAFEKGQQSIVLDTKKWGVKKGNYVLTLYYNNRNSFVWITEE
jgi:hypothetical protein